MIVSNDCDHHGFRTMELAPSRIRVNVVCPGAIDTGIHEKTEKRDLVEIETAVEYSDGNIP